MNLTLDVECALPNFLRRLFKWNDLITELKIKDKHLQKMPLYLRNKILYGKDSGKSQSHCGSHGKDKRLTTDDVLLISHVMFPGGHVSTAGSVNDRRRYNVTSSLRRYNVTSSLIG